MTITTTAPAKTVLIVEDERELREMMQDVLRMHGFDAVTATDGQHALEVLAGIRQACLIVLDLVMPRMDGWTFLERLRGDPGLRHIPVIVHTSSPKQAPQGANKVMQKPVEIDRFIGACRELCATGLVAIGRR